MARRGYLFARLAALGIKDSKATRHLLAYLASDGDTTNMAQLDPAAARRLTEAITRVDEEINGPGAF